MSEVQADINQHEAKVIDIAVKKLPLKKKILGSVRMLFLSHKTFVGKYADILIERKQFIADRKIIVVGDNWIRHSGHRKIHKQTIFYVADNPVTRFFGFYKVQEHYSNA